MTWFRLPLFVWSIYATSIIMVLATPVLAMTLLLVIAERWLGIADLRSRARRRPAAVPAPVLVLHPPGRLHHDPAGDGRDLARSSPASRGGASSATASWSTRSVGDRGDRLPRLGPPHVRGRPVALRRPRVLVPVLPRRGAVGDQGVQLDRDALPRPDRLRRADALRARLHRPVHHRRADRPVPRLARRSTCT